MWLSRYVQCLMLSLALGCGGASAATFEVEELTTSGPSRSYIHVRGELRQGEFTDFFRLVRRQEQLGGVLLDSPGGSFDDGVAIAKYVYEQQLDTVVLRQCHSVCAVIFLAGRQRYLRHDAVVSLHNAYKELAGWVVVDHSANGAVAWFLGHMG